MSPEHAEQSHRTGVQGFDWIYSRARKGAQRSPPPIHPISAVA